MKIAVRVLSQMKGLLISIAKILARQHEVTFLIHDSNVAFLISDLAPELEDRIYLIDDGDDFDPDRTVLLSECRKREDLYGENFSMLCAHDRGIGRGYITNADNYPNIATSWWSHNRKLESILSQFLQYEKFLDEVRPDLILGLVHNKILTLIARERHIPYLTLNHAKYQNRYLWSDTEFYNGNPLLATIAKTVDKYTSGEKSVRDQLEYKQVTESVFEFAKIRYTFSEALRKTCSLWLNDTYKILKGKYTKDSYPYLGWVPTAWRKPLNFNYHRNFGKKPEDLEGYRVVYYPLNLEPEISLLLLSPEFSNSQEALIWLSKSLPADCLLVVKEQPQSFGVRSRKYYELLRQMANVVIAHPDIHSWTWIKRSSLVATITGTAGVEGVFFKKPVLSYGNHQAVNLLPTVRYATDYVSTRKAVKELLAMDERSEKFDISCNALHDSIFEVSFPLDNIEKIYKGTTLETGLAQVTIDGIKKSYPDLMSQE